MGSVLTKLSVLWAWGFSLVDLMDITLAPAHSSWDSISPLNGNGKMDKTKPRWGAQAQRPGSSQFPGE